jgi:hypothetical protein
MESSRGKVDDLPLPGFLEPRGGGARASGEADKFGGGRRPGSFAGHYGQLILADGVAPIPRALYFYQGALNLSPQQVWFISYVFSHKWDDDLPHPRLNELARRATLGLRQIKNIKKSIVEAGLLDVTPTYDSEGGQGANSYDFGPLFDRLETLMAADATAPGDELSEGLPHDEPAREELHGPESEGIPGEGAARDYSFAARYGRVVLRRGVAAIPRALYTYQGDLRLSPQQMWFIGYILSFQWSTELPYPSLRKMARCTGYSERQIHRIKDELVRAGHLRVIERRRADGGGTTSAYDFGELMLTLNTLIRRHSPRARGAGGVPAIPVGAAKSWGSQRTEFRSAPGRMEMGGEARVSGAVNSTSVDGEPPVSGRENSPSEEGVNPPSVGRVNSPSYEIEAGNEEANKGEEYQQQPQVKMDEAQERAYYTLVDVGVIPTIALDLASRFEPDHILGWVRYYLSVLSRQKSLDNPLGLLVKQLRSGDEPPCVPSPGDLQSLRLQLSRFNF